MKSSGARRGTLRYAREERITKQSKLAITVRSFTWVVCIGIEITAYFLAPYWLYYDMPKLFTRLLSPTYSIMGPFDVGPTMSAWDVSLYTGYNTTAAENEILLRDLLNRMDNTSSEETINAPMNSIPFTMTLGLKKIYLPSITKTTASPINTTERYTLLCGKLFTIANPNFNPLESIVLYTKITNKRHGYETLRVYRASQGHGANESLVDITAMYPNIVGQSKYLLCVTNFDANTIKCGSIVLSAAMEKSLTPDVTKLIGGATTPPSCTVAGLKNTVYSISDVSQVSYYCTSDDSIADVLGFENWMVSTGIPSISSYKMVSAVHFAPTGFRLPYSGAGFLDATPNLTAVMVPTMHIANEMWNGQTSRIDYIIQTQILFLSATRFLIVAMYLALVLKFSWRKNRNVFHVLVDNFSLEVTNNSSMDMTVAFALITTYWTYRELIIAMLVRQCLAILPWNSNPLHTYLDNLVFIPGPVCFTIIVGMCVMKHVLNSCRQSFKIAYVATYFATVVLTIGALTHQGPAYTAVRSTEPYAFRPTLVSPMMMFYYRTSPHANIYFYMAYGVGGAIAFAVILLNALGIRKRQHDKCLVQSVAILANTSSEPTKDLFTSYYSSFDVAVGLAIRFPGGYIDTTRMYLYNPHNRRVKATVYCVALAGYVQVDGYLMPMTSVQRCLLACLLGSSIDTAGPIHYFKLSDDRTFVHGKIHRSFPTEFIRGKSIWETLSSLSLDELE